MPKAAKQPPKVEARSDDEDYKSEGTVRFAALRGVCVGPKAAPTASSPAPSYPRARPRRWPPPPPRATARTARWTTLTLTLRGTMATGGAATTQ